jgi:hypothetical protein
MWLQYRCNYHIESLESGMSIFTHSSPSFLNALSIDVDPSVSCAEAKLVTLRQGRPIALQTTKQICH